MVSILGSRTACYKEASLRADNSAFLHGTCWILEARLSRSAGEQARHSSVEPVNILRDYALADPRGGLAELALGAYFIAS